MTKEDFEDIKRQEQLAKFFVSLGNRTRIAIVENLACRDQCVKDNILNVSGFARFTVGQNLKDLKKQGLVTGSFSSKNLSYCLDYQKIEEFKILFDGFYEKLMKNKENVNPQNEPCGTQ